MAKKDEDQKKGWLYRPERAQSSRWTCATVLLATGVYGAYSFHQWVPSSWREPIEMFGLGEVLGDQFPISVGFFGSVIILLAFVVGGFLILNWKRYVDFLHEMEQELGKVAWSSGTEVYNSSVVVLLTVVILALYIGIVDLIFVTIRNTLRDFVLGG